VFAAGTDPTALVSVRPNTSRSGESIRGQCGYSRLLRQKIQQIRSCTAAVDEYVYPGASQVTGQARGARPLRRVHLHPVDSVAGQEQVCAYDVGSGRPLEIVDERGDAWSGLRNHMVITHSAARRPGASTGHEGGSRTPREASPGR
jgi:hypothetical protein